MDAKLRVLLLEDSADDTELLLRRLRQGGYALEWRREECAEGLRRALAEGSWDLIVSDHSMPRLSALAALEAVRESGLDLPVIILSGTIGEDAAVAAMKAGAVDYIMKDRPGRLLPAVARELREAANRRQTRAAEGQLRAAQRLESIGRLAGGVAHDFNNLLTAILGNCELLLRGAEKGCPWREEVAEIQQAGERAAHLTRQLLAFSRRQVLTVRVLELNAVVEGVRTLLRRVIGEDLELEVDAAPELPCVRADAGQLEQVLMNLCVNARDAMPGGGRITIRTLAVTLAEGSPGGPPEARPGPYALLSVADTGAGIDPETLGHIFEPFFTTKPAGQGTGLGLSTVYGIVTQSGGHITVDSRPGEGAEFRVYLPAAAGPVEAAAPARSARAAGGRETLLVVEDEPAVRRVLVRSLAGLGYRVLEAADGASALALFGRERVDLVLTDLVMPRTGGAELARALRALRPELKLLFVTGYSENLAAGQEAVPAAPVLAKPFTPEALAAKVREVLDG